MSDILPCPFCGAKPTFPPASDVYGTCYDFGCDDCGLAGGSFQIIDCFDHPRQHIHEAWDKNESRYSDDVIEVARAQAIEAWNERAA